VFDGDPQARVKDRDRDRATYVVDAALRSGQISQQDRDLRVERVRSAATVGELVALTRDLVSAPAAVPPTAVVPPVVSTGSTTSTSSTSSPSPTSPTVPADPYAPGSTRPVAGVPSDLYGPPPSTTKKVASGTGLTVKPAAGRKLAMGCALIVALFIIVPVAAGVIIFASSDTGGSDFVTEEPVASGPPFELTAAGIRDYVGSFGEAFGGTDVVRTVFYDGYVVSWVPQGDGVAVVNYSNGVFDQFGDAMTDTEDTAPVDLAELRPGRVMALVRKARAFGLTGTVTTYVIYDRDIIEGTPHVMVYVSNDQGESGYVIGDLDGKVLTTVEPS
jgi:hypothetical protein